MKPEEDELPQHLQPSKVGFSADPFGYSALAWHKWGLAQSISGFAIDLARPPRSEELKSPVLWLSHAHALSQAATIVLLADPPFDEMPRIVRGITHSQYFAVGLMLMGYSLEVCLKAILIIRKGVESFMAEERSHRHHRLDDLAEFIPDLSEKDKAILQCLTFFVIWAGRYPDPGSGREGDSSRIFELSERHQIAAKDVVALAVRVMGHAKAITA